VIDGFSPSREVISDVLAEARALLHVLRSRLS